MHRLARVLLRYLVLWVVLTALAVWWVARRGEMGVGEALPTGIVGGTVLAIVVIATLRAMRRRNPNTNQSESSG